MSLSAKKRGSTNHLDLLLQKKSSEYIPFQSSVLLKASLGVPQWIENHWLSQKKKKKNPEQKSLDKISISCRNCEHIMQSNGIVLS